MAKYISYDINTLENIKMGSQGSQYDNEYALSYIAGSTLRGAFINRIINEKGIKDISKDKKYSKLFLKGGLKFLNAYPLVKDLRAVPFPGCFYVKKEDIKKYDGKVCIKLKNELDEKIEEGYEKFKPDDFCIIDYDDSDESYTLEHFPVKKTFSLHISKSSELNNIFRYEAIKKGQKFQGIIVVDDETADLEELRGMLEGQIFYFGGSKGSGYGRCLVENVKVHNINVEAEQFEDFINDGISDEFYLLALSDIIWRNSNGEVVNYIDEEYLEKKLGIKNVKLEGSSVAPQVISGYNAKWGCRLPQILGIKAGSVFKYSFEGTIDRSKLMEFINKGLGDRKEDGYGRIVIVEALYCDEIRAVTRLKDKNTLQVNLTEDHKLQLQNILSSIYKTIVEDKINEKILYYDSKFSKRLSNSQVGKLIQLCVNIKTLSVDKGKEKFKKYLDHIFKDKINNKKIAYKYEDTKIDNINFSDWIRRFAENCDDIVAFHSSFFHNRKDINVAGVTPFIDREFVYQTNIQLLEEFLRFQQRKEKK